MLTFLGKAKVMFAGAVDDLGEEGQYEFSQMKATLKYVFFEINLPFCSSAEDALAGRAPQEGSRPTTSTRSGFVESQGSGIHILMSASTALKMGVPIYGVIQHIVTATDKQGTNKLYHVRSNHD